MKVAFKKPEQNANHELVYVNEILEGIFYFEPSQSAFIYEPTTGPQIILPQSDDAEARQTLIGKLSQLYH
jgi:hypothetical protein